MAVTRYPTCAPWRIYPALLTAPVCYKSDIPMAEECLLNGLENNHLDSVQEAINLGADLINKLPKFKATPLQYACKMGYKRIAEAILNAGVSPNRGRGISPLSLSVKYGHYESTQLLIEKRADVNQRDKLRWMPGLTPISTRLRFPVDDETINPFQS